MDIEDLIIFTNSTCQSRCVRSKLVRPLRKQVFGFNAKSQFSEDEIVAEAQRCLFCPDPPCMKCCPSNVDVREYIHAVSARNFYYAAKVILSSNPLPLSTAALCNVEKTCQGVCNLKNSIGGSIKSHLIQQLSVRKFKEYNIKQIVPQDVDKKVAIIGAGPSGLSCAAFLRRFGYEVTVFEKDLFAGGILMKEIIPNKLPAEDIEFEIQMLIDIGVKFSFGKELGKDYTLNSLSSEFDAVFIAIGRSEIIVPNFPFPGAKTGHEFLSNICQILKIEKKGDLPDYTSKTILVIGSGDTAIDCAISASRLGGRTTLAFRKDFGGITINPKQILKLLEENIEILPVHKPIHIENGKVTFKLQLKGTDGIYYDGDETVIRKFDEVILSFGASKGKLSTEIKSEGQKVIGYNNVFIGGDFAGSDSVIEAVNDGKNAAKLIAESFGNNSTIPLFQTEVDSISLSTEFNGLKFPNPFLISSSQTSRTYEYLRNSLKAGFGSIVTKTILLTKDVRRKKDLQIMTFDDNPEFSLSYSNDYMTIEQNFDYWIDTIQKLKSEFPDRVLIASIAAQDNKDDWKFITRTVIEAGADALELDLSYPNEYHDGQIEKDSPIEMELKQTPEYVQRICSYVAEISTVPFYCKLIPSITNYISIAKAAIEGNANGISMVDTVNDLAKLYPNAIPDTHIRRSEFNIFEGLTDEQIYPIAQKQVINVHNELPNTSIIGIGGIWNTGTALQFLYAGANVVQISTGVMRFSYDIIREMISGFQFILYCYSRPDLRSKLSNGSNIAGLPHPENSLISDGKIPQINDLRGLHTKKSGLKEKSDSSWTLTTTIDQSKCLQCGSCSLTCRESSVDAIEENSEGQFVVNPSICIGCEACHSVCPAGAIGFTKIPVHRSENNRE
jgi:dihydropyrimidine dehydrogenase (NADP+)